MKAVPKKGRLFISGILHDKLKKGYRTKNTGEKIAAQEQSNQCKGEMSKVFVTINGVAIEQAEVTGDLTAGSRLTVSFTVTGKNNAILFSNFLSNKTAELAVPEKNIHAKVQRVNDLETYEGDLTDTTPIHIKVVYQLHNSSEETEDIGAILDHMVHEIVMNRVRMVVLRNLLHENGMLNHREFERYNKEIVDRYYDQFKSELLKSEKSNN